MVLFKDESRRGVGRLGAMLALCASMAALSPAATMAASNAKAKAAASGGHIVGASDPDAIPGSYIVVFKTRPQGPRA
jgi:hypothetical protein